MSLNKSSWNECIKILTWPSTKWEKNILYVSERAKYKSTYWNLANYLVKVLCLNLFFFIALKSMMHFYIKHIYHQPTPPLITHRCDIQCPFISLISNIVLLLYYNTGCSIQIWLFWHDNKYLGIELRGGGGGSYGHSNCCCCSSSVIALCVVKSEKIFNLP